MAQLPPGALDAGPSHPVTCHDFCQSHNVLGVGVEPRRLITEVMGDASSTCGGADASGRPLRVLHMAELVDERLRQLG